MNALSDTGIKTTQGHSRVLYVLMVACLPVVVAGCLTMLVFTSGAVKRDSAVGQQSKFAQIDYPQSVDLVADKFSVTGRINSVPAGEVVYLVERVGNRFWPKQRIGTEPTDFKRTQHTSPGKGYKYTIELLSMNASAHAHTSGWFEHGKKTGAYPGIGELDGITVLASVRVVRQ